MGRIGVKAKRPIPMATASAASPARATVAGARWRPCRLTIPASGVATPPVSAGIVIAKKEYLGSTCSRYGNDGSCRARDLQGGGRGGRDHEGGGEAPSRAVQRDHAGEAARGAARLGAFPPTPAEAGPLAGGPAPPRSRIRGGAL